MKKFTYLIALFLLVAAQTVFAQKVVVIGMNHISPDAFSFLATEDLPIGEVVYFTENEYSDVGNAFTGQDESVVKFTVSSAINKGNVVFVQETDVSSNIFTVLTTSGMGTAIKTAGSGSFSIATGGESFYAYFDINDDPTDGISEIYSVIWTGSGEAFGGGPTSGGSIPPDLNPANDFTNAIVVDGFTYLTTPESVEFNTSAAARTNVSKAMLENPSNYETSSSKNLFSTQFFTNLNLSGTNPALTVTASPSSVTENSGSSITYTFSLSANAGTAITVNFSVGGTATFNTDYTQSGAATFTATTGTVTILSGTNTASFTITPVGDNTLEPNETILLTLTAGTGYDAGSPGAATITITNDDTQVITPLVAVTGINEDDPEGFSFVALDDIASGTIVYFTENSFNNTTLAFTGSEGVLSWTAPGAGVQRGEVIVVKENPANTFTATSNSGNSGTISLISGTLSLASAGEGFYAYSDADSNPLNGVTEVYSVLFTGTTITSGGNIPAIEDPSPVYVGSVVVDGFAPSQPNRTEYDPAKRGVTVDQANFQNVTNWVHAQANANLSPVPFSNIIIASGSANPTATIVVSPSSVLEDSGTGLVYTFSLNAPASGSITVNFSVGGTATYNADYTVTGATSFTASTGSVTILDGTSSAAVTIMPSVDSDVEVLETVSLMIDSGTGYDGGSPNDATGSITNDDTSLSDPLVAITGLKHLDNDGFSFVAAKDIPAGTKIYFTENSFNNTTLMFGSGESVLSWTSPGSVVPAGQVIVVTETAPTSNNFSLARSGGSADYGSITVETTGFAIASDGETFYAYKDNNNDPTDGVEDIYAVLFTGVSGSPGGTIPATEDPSGIYLSALVVDGFPATQPNRTEYDPTKRNVLVEAVDFENTANWLHAETNQVLSTVPFDNIQIVDLIPPVALCKDITVNLFGSTLNIAGIDIDNGSSDNIGVVSYSLDIATFTCADVGTPVTVTLTVADAAGNTDNCTATVTVVDSKAPSPICINGLSFNLDASGNFTLKPDDIIASPITDNCSSVTYSLSKSDFTCANLGTNIIQLHATDDSGNDDYCETYIVVNDVTPPTAICQNIDVYLDGSGNTSITVADIDGGSTDNCGTVSLSASLTSFTCADLGPNNVTLTVDDGNGNSSDCVAVVTVIDTISPTAVCQNINVYVDGAGNATIVAADIDGGSTDNCSAVTLSASTITFSCADLGPNNVTLTVTDQSTNSANCAAVVTVIDSIAPTAICQNITVNLDAAGAASIVAADIDGGSTDNCGTVTLSASSTTFTCAELGDNNVTLTVDDGNGNTSDCVAVVTVVDAIAPTAVCQNITVNLDATGAGSIVAADIDGGSTDNCGSLSLSASTTSFTCSDIGLKNVTLTVDDGNGNTSVCVAVVTIIDGTAPTAVCKNIDVYIDAAGTAAIVAADIDGGSTDNCSAVTLSASTTTFSCADLGPNNVTLTVTDQSTNSANCVSIVTVIDSIPPVAICRDITVNLDGAGNATITAADIDNGSTDNCSLGVISASQTSFTCADIGSKTVTLTVSDMSGNSSTCTSTVTVVDAFPPLAVCKDAYVYLDGSGNAGIAAADIDGGSTDNCGLLSLTASQTSFNCDDIGLVNVTLTVADVNGEVSTCTASVYVSDLIFPVAKCKDITVSVDGGVTTISASDIDNGSTDNCGIEVMKLSKTDFTIADIGTNKVTLTAYDKTGYFGSCEAVVTIGDYTAPDVSCNSIDIILDETGAYELTANDILNLSAGSSDNLDSYNDLDFTASPVSFSCENVGGETTIVLTATDKAGNSSTCSTLVNVLDTTTLVINPVDDVKVELSQGVCETEITYPEIVSLNACASISQVSGLGADGVFPVGTTTETWMATNTNGDTVEVSFNVIITSVNALPSIDPIADIRINEGTKTADVKLTGISQGMDCDIQNLMISSVNTDTTLITDIMVDYTAPDSTGMLYLAIAPEMIGVDTITVTVSDGESSVSEKFVINIAHVNRAPVVVNPIDDQVIIASHVLKIPISTTDNSVFEDLDGDTLKYSLLVDGKPELPAWMTVENDSLILAPAIADTGCVVVVVIAIDPYNAMAADTFQLCVDGYPTGSNDLNASTFDVKMFPNPTKGEVYLKINSSEILDSEVIVRSITGSEVFRKGYKASELIKIDLSENVSGIYLVTLQTGNKSVVKKLIIDRK